MNDHTKQAKERQVSISSGNVMDEARALLNHLFAGVAGYVELTYIKPPGLEIDGPHIVTESYRIGQDRPDWAHIAAMNAKGYGVYYALTSKRERRGPHNRSDERNTHTLSALWVDIDMQDGHYPDKDTAFELLCHFRPAPTAIIDSGGGLHGLWRIQPLTITSQNLSMVKARLAGLAAATMADPKVAETARVFRLPGTINTKPERHGAKCELQDGMAGITRYRLEDFPTIALPQPRPQVRVTVPEGVKLKLPSWVTDYLATGEPQGNRNHRLYAAGIEYRVNGFSFAEAQRDLGSRASADGLSEREIDRTLQSAWHSDAGTPNLSPTIRTLIQVTGVAS